jgi:hypothetical protein
MLVKLVIACHLLPTEIKKELAIFESWAVLRPTDLI